MTSRTTSRMPQKGDIWLVEFPYFTPGNMVKVRPAIVLDYNEDTDKVKMRRLTTQKKKGYKPFINDKMKKRTYITRDIMDIPYYNLIRYIGKA